MDDNKDNIVTVTNSNRIKNLILNFVLIIGFLCIFFYYFLSAPFGNKDVIVHVSSSQPVDSVLDELNNKNVIRNNFSTKIFIKLLKKGKGIINGDYLFEKNSPAWKVAWQLGRGKHNIEPIRITIKEGYTNEEIAKIFADKLTGFRKDIFLNQTTELQGYLFPDTYFFFPLDTTDEIIDKLYNNFNNKTKNLNFGTKKIDDIITMASILEKEANGKEDIYIISGILWKRISINMPLQVDVDKQTYKNVGLPANPINNPGLVAIDASIKPTNSPYLYYLHDKNGTVHYAKSYNEHVNNINKYLK